MCSPCIHACMRMTGEWKKMETQMDKMWGLWVGECLSPFGGLWSKVQQWDVLTKISTTLWNNYGEVFVVINQNTIDCKDQSLKNTRHLKSIRLSVFRWKGRSSGGKEFIYVYKLYSTVQIQIIIFCIINIDYNNAHYTPKSLLIVLAKFIEIS